MSSDGLEIAKAYVQILPSTKGIKGRLTEGLSGEANEAGEKSGSTIAGKIKKALAVIGASKVIADIGNAIVDITKQSVNAAGEYEQLAGGVEKIFDGMDTSSIIADANAAYKSLGLSANEYLATINDVGASFASTMGAKAGYDNAKKGLQAISDYASGTGKSVDVLKEKFGMITRSTSSYQSIADQFSGILPATSADFLKQAQAAGYLSTSYKKLTEVPIEEYQQAVTNMLAKGVDALNLTGNTAEEATETLTGSFGMLKSAWANMLTAMGSGENIEGATSALTESIQAVIGNLVPMINGILPQIPILLNNVVTLLLDELPGIAETLIPTVIDLISNLGLTAAEHIPELILAVVNALQAGLPQLATSAVEIVSALAVNLTAPDTLIPLLEAAIELIVAVVNGIVDALPALGAAGPEIIGGLVAAIVGALPGLLIAAGDIISELTIGIISEIPAIIDSGIDVVMAFGDGIGQAISDAWTWGADLLDNFIEGISSRVSNLIQSVFGIAEKIKGYLGFSEPDYGPLSNFHTFAPDMMDLFIQGIDSNEKRLTGRIEKVFDFRDAIQAPESEIYTYADITAESSSEKDSTIRELLISVESLKAYIRALKIVLDSGAVVGGISDMLDEALGEKSALKARGI